MSLDKIIDSCSYLLNNYPGASEVRDYLNARLLPETQKEYKFGYFPSVDNISLLENLVSEKLLLELKLLYSRNIEDSWGPRQIKTSYFNNYPLIMPYTNVYGDTIGIVGRVICNEDERQKLSIPKYKNTVFKKSMHLFGLDKAKEFIMKEDCVYIVEGQFDCIKSYEKGFKNVVALGSASLTDYQVSLLNRYTNNIFLLLDNDEAGNKSRIKIINKYSDLTNIRDLYLPKQYKDIDEFFNHNNYNDLSFSIKI